MAERKKAKKKGKEEVVCQVPLKPTKDEYAIAKYLRSNLPTKKTKFLQHTVEFFTASKAVDMLMDSPWSSDKSKTTVKFTTRDEIVDYLDIMLRHKFFHRARRVPVTARDLRGKALKKFQEEQEKLKELERQKAERDKKKGKSKAGGDVAETKKSGDEKTPSDEDSKAKKKEDGKGGEKDKGKEEEKKGLKRRIKLEMHLDQQFVDGPDAYVWIYDPTPWYYWLLSIFVVLGAIALCLFPLWPSSVRKGVYYLSLAAAGFLIFILGLVVVRVVVFCFIWLLTFGRHHLWLLPNLTEDVGFFASFWPLFQYEYKGPGSKDKKKKKKKGKDDEEESSDSGSGSEEEDDDDSKADNERSKKEESKDKSSTQQSPSPGGKEAAGDDKGEDDEDEGSQSSRNSQQTDKEFEIIGSGEATEEDVPDPE